MWLLRRFKNFDWVLMGCLAFLAAVSLVTLASSNRLLFSRQVIWYVLAFAAIMIGSQVNWRWLIREPLMRYGLYAVSVFLVIIANFQAGTVRGTKSWLTLGDLQFQPAEFTKIALIFVLAGFFSRKYLAAWHTRNIFTSLLYTLLPAVPVALHPDFGSAVVLLGIWVGFLLMSGVNKKRFLVGLMLSVVLAVILWSFFLQEYQKERIRGFIFPERDPLGANYNVIQSKIAVGSAGFFGKGFGGGTQTRLKFLPESSTDFLFAAFTEEWGFLGSSLLILTVLIVLTRINRIGIQARGNTSKFVCLGAGLVFTIHFTINVGSNLGLVPVTGLPFPLVSYGGSHILTGALLIAIIQHIKLESSSY